MYPTLIVLLGFLHLAVFSDDAIFCLPKSLYFCVYYICTFIFLILYLYIGVKYMFTLYNKPYDPLLTLSDQKKGFLREGERMKMCSFPISLLSHLNSRCFHPFFLVALVNYSLNEDFIGCL